MRSLLLRIIIIIIIIIINININIIFIFYSSELDGIQNVSLFMGS